MEGGAPLIEEDYAVGIPLSTLRVVGVALLLDRFARPLRISERLFFRLRFNRRSVRSIAEVLTARPWTCSYRSHSAAKVRAGSWLTNAFTHASPSRSIA